MQLVSIMSPTYNNAECLPYFLDSILAQTYPRVQLVIVDDGSTDSTPEVLDAYEPRFAARGYRLTILHQANQGLAGAINTALKHIEGELLMWMDSDDMLESSAITEMQDCLTAHPEAELVLCDAQYVSYPDFSYLYTLSRTLKGRRDPYFYDILKGKHNYTLGCGSCLVRRESLARAIPQMQIYPSRLGQNYQLMLPLTYFCKRAYLHKPLFIRVVRSNSLAHTTRSYAQQLERNDEFIVLMKTTVAQMHIPEEKRAFRLIERRFARKSFTLAYSNYDAKRMRRELVRGAASPKALWQYFKHGTRMGRVIAKWKRG